MEAAMLQTNKCEDIKAAVPSEAVGSARVRLPEDPNLLLLSPTSIIPSLPNQSLGIISLSISN
jgi:hypothetical protein